MTKKAAIYNPYLDTLGGGERYTFSFAAVLRDLGYQVDIQWPEQEIINKMSKRFNINFKRLEVVDDINRGEEYDVCFWVSDGSIPMLKSRKNLLHFQVPFKDVDGKSLMNRMKMFRINKIICNSHFTKNFIEDEYPGEKIVIYPPVDTSSFKKKKKENIIVYLGRFSQLTQSKNQDILVERFKSFYDSGYREWKLILMGGTEVGVDDYLKNLKNASEGYPIKIIESPTFDKLTEIIGKAKIFWSAAGYGVDEQKEPQKVEHFGITTVEAMSAGAVPVVYNAGGQREIIANGINGYLWNKKQDLVNITKKLSKDSKLINQLSKKAIKDSKVYEYERFEAEVKKLFN